DDARLPQSVHFFNLQVRNHAVRVFWVADQSGHVTHENQPPGLEPNGSLCGGHVRIAVVDPAIFTPRRGADDRRDAAPDALAQRLGVHLRHFADKTDVEVFAVRPLQEQLSAGKKLRAGKAARLATQCVDGLDNLRIDFPRQHVFDHVYHRFIRHAHALDEIGVDPGDVRGAGDGLAAAMDDDRVDAYGFQEHDVACNAVAHLWIGRIHETAAIFDDERLAAEPLDVGQRFQQRRGFGNEILHRFNQFACSAWRIDMQVQCYGFSASTSSRTIFT